MNRISLFGLALAMAATAPAATPAEKDSSSRLWVRLKDQQGNPITARIYLRGEQGEYHIPEGSIGRGRRERFFHARGQFQTVLPPGKYTVEAVKGFEYEPVTKDLNLSFIELNDRTTTETITLKRVVDMPALGWYSGDVHMHPNHREGGLYMTMADCELLAAGEDIRVANLLISNRQYTTRVFDTEFFRDGEVDPASSSETMMVVQEEFRNTSDMYGHMPLLGIKRLVEPFFSGERPYWEDYPPNYSTAKRVQEMGGVVSYAHPATRLGVLLGPHQAREFPIDLALGVINALDVLSNSDEVATTYLYYRVLNSGLRCTASAGTDTQMDVPDNGSISGGGRVYVKVEPPLTYPKWIEGYRAGRTFVSNGPMLFLNVDGKGPGDEIRLTGPKRVTVTAEAHSIPPMQALELIVNGEVVAKAEPSADGTAAKLSHLLEVDASAWVAARVRGAAHRRVMNDSHLFAHTSPVYLLRDGKPVAIAKDAGIVLGWIDRLIEDVKKSPRFAKEAHRQEVLEIFHRGRRHYEKIASVQ
jgi:TolB protein